MVEASVDVLEGVVMEVMKEVAVMMVARQVAKRVVVRMVAVMEAVVTVEAMAAEGMVAAMVGRGSKEDQAEVMAVVEQEERKEGTEVAVARLAEQ